MTTSKVALLASMFALAAGAGFADGHIHMRGSAPLPNHLAVQDPSELIGVKATDRSGQVIGVVTNFTSEGKKLMAVIKAKDGLSYLVDLDRTKYTKSQLQLDVSNVRSLKELTTMDAGRGANTGE